MAGERRVITVLFCDVVDSTALAAQFDPEEWAEVMNEAFRHMIGPVEGYGGMVARLMGDSVLAFFGAPLAHEDDPQRAILAGLGIVTRIRGFARQFEKDYGLSFAVRVGINTGPAVVGEIGTTSAQSGEYTAMGDAINLAARMEQTAVAGTVQISADTYKLVAPLFDVWDLGKVAVKGKDEPVQAYRVLGLEPQPGRWRGLDGPRTPIVGRERELERVRELLHGLKQQHSGICYLIGEAGLGKSRLIAELRHYWRDNLSNREDGRNPMLRDWSEFVALSYGASQPYDILRRQLRTFCGIRENDPQPVIRERLDALLGLYPEALHERMCQAFIPLLTDTPTEGEIFIQGEAYQRELRQVVVQMVGELMRLGPLVFVVDDVHWADTSSLDILHHLLPLVEQGPILFLFAMRPDRQTPAWQLFLETQAGHSQHCIAVHLEPLTVGAQRQGNVAQQDRCLVVHLVRPLHGRLFHPDGALEEQPLRQFVAVLRTAPRAGVGALDVDGAVRQSCDRHAESRHGEIPGHESSLVQGGERVYRDPRRLEVRDRCRAGLVEQVDVGQIQVGNPPVPRRVQRAP